MTKDEKQKIAELQRQGLGYKRIAAVTGISVNTVKSFCKAHPFGEDVCRRCPQCGKPIFQPPHKREKKFCSDRCRNAWWSAHPEMRKKEKPYQHKCLYCGSVFSSDRAGSIYCSVSCFANARRKEVRP